ncbi:hypothetical protein [Pantoea ananatis]|uniref:hypothetical protein n=1 Tax=Pantoea ananas TaxID=553 RepID=UPI000E30867E|nr:hypothetical protein [Pantoea ananatis]
MLPLPSAAGITKIPLQNFLHRTEKVFGFKPPEKHDHGAVGVWQAEQLVYNVNPLIPEYRPRQQDTQGAMKDLLILICQAYLQR